MMIQNYPNPQQTQFQPMQYPYYGQENVSQFQMQCPPQNQFDPTAQYFQQGAASYMMAQTERARFKTEMCKNFKKKGGCPYGTKCRFAHGKEELQMSQCQSSGVFYPPQICQEYHYKGYCTQEDRCIYYHEEKSQERVEEENNIMGKLESKQKEIFKSQFQQLFAELKKKEKLMKKQKKQKQSQKFLDSQAYISCQTLTGDEEEDSILFNDLTWTSYSCSNIQFTPKKSQVQVKSEQKIEIAQENKIETLRAKLKNAKMNTQDFSFNDDGQSTEEELTFSDEEYCLSYVQAI